MSSGPFQLQSGGLASNLLQKKTRKIGKKKENKHPRIKLSRGSKCSPEESTQFLPSHFFVRACRSDSQTALWEKKKSWLRRFRPPAKTPGGVGKPVGLPHPRKEVANKQALGELAWSPGPTPGRQERRWKSTSPMGRGSLITNPLRTSAPESFAADVTLPARPTARRP